MQDRADGLLGTSIGTIFAHLLTNFEKALRGCAYREQCGLHTTFYRGTELQVSVPMSAFEKIFPLAKNTSERNSQTAMIKEITIGEEKLEIDLDGAPLWKIWILHIVLLVRFGKLLKETQS